MATEVTLYTRRDCQLCDKAKAAIRAAESLHRLAIVLQEVDVDADPELHAKFTNEVPVIYVDGKEAFRHRVTPEELTTYIRGGARPPSALASEKCIPCRGGVPPLKGDDLTKLARELGGGWDVADEHQLEKQFTFPDFAQALAFTNKIGALAEEEQHHPDILLGWGKVGVTLWTHVVDGLTRADFVLAAKIDQLL
jgi:4a-hydroxytetrahydrobiopterin dehydratase